MPRSCTWLLLLSSYWLGSALQAHAANSFQAYPIDWALVPSSPETTTNLSSSCICALLNSVTCTPNCCCDPACPASAVNAFRDAGSCLPEGPPPEQLAYCLPDEPFAKVNLPAGDFYRIQKAAAGADFLTQLLCIAADHNPSLGINYPDPPAGDVGTNAQQAACPAAIAAAAPTSSYSYGQAVIVSAPAGGARVRGPFTLPAGVLSAECLDMQQVGFMQRLPASLRAQTSSCQRTFSSAAALSTTCNNPDSALSPTYFAGLQFPPSPASSLYKSVTVTSLSRLGPATGVLTALDPAADLAAPTTAAGPPAACNGVVLAAHLLFRYSADGGINLLSSVGVHVVIGDVAMPSDGSPLVVNTALSVSWASTAAADDAMQPLSGAPGYLTGFPLLAGVLATAPPGSPGGSQAVSRFTGGLQLPAATAAGRCSASSLDWLGVGFGYNTSSSCGIGLTRTQLRTFCTANDPAKTLSDLLGGWLDELTTQQVVLGIWGNANTSNTNHWVPLQASSWPPTTDLAWDETTATCSNIITGFDINVVTGVAFASGNLQSKVLYGQTCFRRGSWTFNQVAGPALQIFPMQFTVKFVAKEQPAPAVSLKPAPPLFAPLPPDLFYPFLTSGASAAWGQPVDFGQLLFVLCGVVLSQLLGSRL